MFNIKDFSLIRGDELPSQKLTSVKYHQLKELFEVATEHSQWIGQIGTPQENHNKRINYEDFEKAFNQKISEHNLTENIQVSKELNMQTNAYTIKISFKNIMLGNILGPLTWSGPDKNGFHRAFYFDKENIESIIFSFDYFFADEEHYPPESIIDFYINHNNVHDQNKIIISNSDFCHTRLNLRQFKIVEIINSKGIKYLDLGFRCENILLKDSLIDNIELGTSSEYIKVLNTSIKTIEPVWFIQRERNLKVLIFDQKSTILSSAYESYKNLRIISGELNDPIQKHIFYNKEINAFSSEKNTDIDSKFLISTNRILNRNGSSIFLPVYWIFWFNLVLISSVVITENLLGNHTSANLIYRFIDIIPLSSVVSDNFSNLSYGLDGLRRAILSGLYYLLIVSALRYRYKSTQF